MSYQATYLHSINEPATFWQKEANAIQWFRAPQNILSRDELGNYRWFEDGELNLSYLCIDYHIEQGRGEQLALIYESPVTNTTEKFTYSQLHQKVAQLAGALQNLGVTKGDTVVIYMPMIPEAAFAMLACARLGAIHSVVFGGFAAHELAIRIDDALPKIIISASCGIEVNHIIPYKPLLDKALAEAKHQPQRCIIYQREMCEASINAPTDLIYQEIIAHAELAACVPVKSTHPLYILYTSGTTGKPKGIVRDSGGYAVAMKYSMKTVYDVKEGEVYWAASDVGWVVGHSYIVYAPLINANTTILFEGKPIKTPDAGTFWRIIEEHRVNTLFTAPTAIRAIKKEDAEGVFLQKYSLESLKNIFLAGERCDPPTLSWLSAQTNKPVIDHWWQTETGWAIVANPIGIESFPIKAGSATLPVCGYNVQVLDEAGNEVKAREEGNICIKLPLPPGCLPTLWKDNERFVQSYLSTYENYYLSGDGGFKDEDGYIYIMGRIDDVINVAGHRLSTGEMEEIIASHNSIAECAVVGVEDNLRGQVPFGLVVLKDGQTIEETQLEKELISLIREKIGAIACFKTAILVKRLPKTRSGKILRKTIRLIIDKKPYTIPSTIDDVTILDEISERLHERSVI